MLPRVRGELIRPRTCERTIDVEADGRGQPLARREPRRLSELEHEEEQRRVLAPGDGKESPLAPGRGTMGVDEQPRRRHTREPARVVDDRLARAALDAFRGGKEELTRGIVAAVADDAAP